MTMLAPMDWIWFSAYCLPARPTVTTKISAAVQITIPTAVRIKRILLVRNESMAMLTVSLKSMVLRAVSAKGRLVIVILYVLLRVLDDLGDARQTTWP